MIAVILVVFIAQLAHYITEAWQEMQAAKQSAESHPAKAPASVRDVLAGPVRPGSLPAPMRDSLSRLYRQGSLRGVELRDIALQKRALQPNEVLCVFEPSSGVEQAALLPAKELDGFLHRLGAAPRHS
ncbi:hypothetical protein [uncultured Aquitalea sp.]|uniref:hypothetical protein n=1 Tax=uncultured Aquitalea sp. TaxID=540272 RepID=UPI0025E7F952|nr:hypothetical protein [uncultured Aquitalea sp.]